MIPRDAKIHVLTWPDIPKRMRSKTFHERKAERQAEMELARAQAAELVAQRADDARKAQEFANGIRCGCCYELKINGSCEDC